MNVWESFGHQIFQEACGKATWNKPCCVTSKGSLETTKGSLKNGISLQLTTSLCLLTQAHQAKRAQEHWLSPKKCHVCTFSATKCLLEECILRQHGILYKSLLRHPHFPPHRIVGAASLPGHKTSSFPSCTPTHRLPVTTSKEETNAS